MDWNDLFPGQTPEQVQAKLAEDKQKLTEATSKLEEWKGHARTWEDRSKENKQKVEKAEADLAAARAAGDPGAVSAAEAELLKQRAATAEGQLALSQKLTLMGAPAAHLMDSKSFMAEVEKLDPESDEYEKTFTELVASRTQAGPAGPFVPHQQRGVFRQVPGGDAPKPSLWDQVHGDKDKKTNTL